MDAQLINTIYRLESTNWFEDIFQKYLDWFSGIRTEFINNFITDDRYMYFLNGLVVTLLITLGSLILGIVLGVVVAIIREDLITDECLPCTPTMMKYKIHADNDSLYNTPPAYGIYICGKVFKWLKKQGGLEAMKEYNEKKAAILYDFLDQSKLFKGTVRKEDRSLMNVPFVTGDADMDAKFVKEATAAGFTNLKGHRSVGGMRASIYNAMPIEGVEKLVEFMKKFEEENNV